jgi:hypothetical protein
VLLDVQKCAESPVLLSLEQRISIALNQKELGNKAFNQQDYEAAKGFYNKV